MRVAKDNHSRFLALQPALKRFIGFVRLHNVMDQKFAPSQLDNFRLPELQTRIVRVAEDRGNRRNLFKLQDQPGLANIATVQDMVNARKEFRDFRIQEIVCIGDDADAEHKLRRLRRDFLAQPMVFDSLIGCGPIQEVADQLIVFVKAIARDGLSATTRAGLQVAAQLVK